LTTLYLAGAKNTDNWRVRKGNLQRAFSLYRSDGSISFNRCRSRW
jgi:hypothetical protein